MQTDSTPLNVMPPRRSLFDRLEDWLWKQQQRDTEAYLATSRDLFELEARISALGRGEPRFC